jgi:hypothetical protein
VTIAEVALSRRRAACDELGVGDVLDVERHLDRIHPGTEGAEIVADRGIVQGHRRHLEAVDVVAVAGADIPNAGPDSQAFQ